MSSTGTRVVPTLTEVLDEQRLAKSPSGLSTEGWQHSRLGDEEIVPISLDWGEDSSASDPAHTQPEDGGVMTPWQVVQPRPAAADAGELPFIDLSIAVAPVRPPALHEQVLEVYAPAPSASSVDAGPVALPQAQAPGPDPVQAVASAASSSAELDPGTTAVRQGNGHVPGISDERLQAILEQALDRLLRDELPSALVETLIRMSPQLSESLIESLKPSLHLHVMEALSAEAVSPPGPSQG